MKGKRHKHVKKTLQFYKVYYSYLSPYNVLIDGTFCKAALTYRVNISEQLPKYLDAEVKFCTTKCVLKECEALGSLLYGPLKVLRQFDTVQCKHDKTLSAAKCLLRFARKKESKRYCIATQDEELSEKIRNIAGTPLVFISHKAITLEAPSSYSKQMAETIAAGKLAPSDHQHQTLANLKREVFGEEEKVTKKRKRKGQKGPNPLSCKKKKKKTVNQIDTGKVEGKKKRKRNRRKKNRGLGQNASNVYSQNGT